MTEPAFPEGFQEIHQRELDLLTRTREALSRIESVDDADRARLLDMIEHLDQLYTLVVVGEFNSGKSSLINALLQDDYLDTGILPTTARINLVQRGHVKGRRLEGDLVVLTHPSKLLDNMQIVDTPGTNAVFRQHEAIARQFVHRSDFVLFVMAATHAFAETDRLYLELLREYGAKVTIVVNQVDLLADESQIAQVLEFVTSQCDELLGTAPRVLPVSAKWALAASASMNPVLRARLQRQSGIQALREIISDALAEDARIRAKLGTPLRVARSIVSRYIGETERQLAAVRSDTGIIDRIEAGDESYRRSVRQRLEGRFGPIDALFEDMYGRGVQFIDDHLQVRRLSELLNWVDFQEGFEQAVVADTQGRIADEVNALVAQLISEDRRQWQETLASLRLMLARYQDDVIGSVQGDFSGSVEVFEENVLHAERALARYGKQDAADGLRDTHMGAIADAAMIGISGLLGGGGLIAFAVSELAEAVTAMHAGAAASALLGPVGWAIGGAAALGGAYVLVQRRLPRARQKARERLRQELDSLRSAFRGALTSSATRELLLFRGHVQGALAPLQSYLSRLAAELEERGAELDGLRQEMSEIERELEPPAAG